VSFVKMKTDDVVTCAPGAPPETAAVVDGDANGMYLDEMRHFIRCVERGEPPMVDGREALRSLRVVEAAKRSAAGGGWVRV